MKKALLIFAVILLPACATSRKFNTIDLRSCREVQSATISGSVLGRDSKVFECPSKGEPFIFVVVDAGKPSIFLMDAPFNILEDGFLVGKISDFIEETGDGTGGMIRSP